MPITAFQTLVEFRDEISEVSLSRVNQWFTGRAPFGMISAFRHERSPEENKTCSHRLAQELRRAGYGYIETWGGYPEETEAGDKKSVQEWSFLVPGATPNGIETNDRLKDVLIQEGKRFSQDTILFRAFRKGEKPEPCQLYSCETGEIAFPSPGAFMSLKQVGDYWSQMRKGNKEVGPKFKFGKNPPRRAKILP